jgi:ApaG protein
MARPEFTVSVKVSYLEEQSNPAGGVFAFAYAITIVNSGDVTAQLVARHWLITDAHGHVDEVRGLVAHDRQPLLKPGERFEYTSWARIATPQGTMRGTFFCMTEDARPFDAPVPEFMLARAEQLH